MYISFHAIALFCGVVVALLLWQRNQIIRLTNQSERRYDLWVSAMNVAGKRYRHSQQWKQVATQLRQRCLNLEVGNAKLAEAFNLRLQQLISDYEGRLELLRKGGFARIDQLDAMVLGRSLESGLIRIGLLQPDNAVREVVH